MSDCSSQSAWHGIDSALGDVEEQRYCPNTLPSDLHNLRSDDCCADSSCHNRNSAKDSSSSWRWQARCGATRLDLWNDVLVSDVAEQSGPRPTRGAALSRAKTTKGAHVPSVFFGSVSRLQLPWSVTSKTPEWITGMCTKFTKQCTDRAQKAQSMNREEEHQGPAQGQAAAQRNASEGGATGTRSQSTTQGAKRCCPSTATRNGTRG